jgi:hypothetical protein
VLNIGGIKWEILTKIEDLEEMVLEEILAKEEILDQEKCIKQHVLTVDVNVKYHSNQQKVEMFFVENASEKEKNTNSFMY